MKTKIAIGLFSLALSKAVLAQQSEYKAIETTIVSFAKAGDANSVTDLENYLDSNFRLVMNRLFGSETVTVMTRSEYLAKIESKEFGGDTRRVTIDQITLNGNSATAKVTMTGTKLTFVSLMILIKDKDGNWKIVSDTPTVL